MGTASVTPVTDVQKTLPGVLDWPGLRTFRSPRFRLVVALVLFLLAASILGWVLISQAIDPHGQFGIDFIVYQKAASDLYAGLSPYTPSMLSGPIAAQGELLYKYAPPFAQLLVPLAGLGRIGGTAIWGIVQGVMAFAAVWLAATYGGARPSVERAMWSAVAIALYLPVFDSIWKGNVSTAQTFLTALTLNSTALGGAAIGTAILLKTSPLALVPAAVAFRRRRVLAGVLVTVIAVVAVSVVLAPAAWLDFLAIQPNLAVGRYDFATNLAPAAWAQVYLPSLPVLATVLRLGALALGVALVAASVVAARRADGWPAAVVCGTVAALVIPGAAWFHYLAVLLPFAAFAWPRASARQRLALFVGAGAVSFGLAWLPLAVAGATLLVITSLQVTWPRSRAASA